jgi:hypothetical protein
LGHTLADFRVCRDKNLKLLIGLTVLGEIFFKLKVISWTLRCRQKILEIGPDIKWEMRASEIKIFEMNFFGFFNQFLDFYCNKCMNSV